MSDTKTVVIEREFSHPPEKLWRALTEPALMEDWLMMKSDFAASIGRKFELRGEWGGVSCEVLTLEPNQKLSYTWNHDHDDPAYALASTVVFTLTPTTAGTHLRMEQSGFRSNQKQAYGGAHAGWKGHFDRLAEVVGRL